jgi:hypothetical protein
MLLYVAEVESDTTRTRREESFSSAGAASPNPTRTKSVILVLAQNAPLKVDAGRRIQGLANGLGFTCGPDRPRKGFRWADRRLPGRCAKRTRGKRAGETIPYRLLARQVQP